MQFLREYGISIITVSVLSVIFEIILPKKTFGKYISVITGLIVMMVIISPVRNLFSDFEMFVIEGETRAEEFSADTSFNLVAREFKKRLEEKIEESLAKTTGKKTEVTISLELNENGEIVTIKEAEISPYSKKSADIIKEEFDIDVKEKKGEEENAN